jgi:transposase-like protein
VFVPRYTEHELREHLVAEVVELGWSAVGRKYGVSDNAVRKWVKAYERERLDECFVADGVE